MRVLLFVLMALGLNLNAKSQSIFSREVSLMGCHFEISVVADNLEEADDYIDVAVDEMTRIEQLISSWDPSSQTSAINNMAGKSPVQVDKELFQLIERAMAISQLTDGAFDLSYASMDRIWKFDGSMKSMPSQEEIAQSVRNVGYENIVLDSLDHSVFLTNQSMKIGFGAIGKGYAADRAKEVLMALGVKGGIINASGDMNSWGKQPDGSDWQVAIVNPFNKEKSFGLFSLESGAVVTSGDYENYVVFDDVRYSHVIDPKTGYPAQGITSVTVFGPSAELADALATSVFVLGVDIGLDRINQLPGVECLIVDDQGELFSSENIILGKE